MGLQFFPIFSGLLLIRYINILNTNQMQRDRRFPSSSGLCADFTLKKCASKEANLQFSSELFAKFTIISLIINFTAACPCAFAQQL